MGRANGICQRRSLTDAVMGGQHDMPSGVMHNFKGERCRGGGNGRRARLKIWWVESPCGFESRPRHWRQLSSHRPYIFTSLVARIDFSCPEQDCKPLRACLPRRCIHALRRRFRRTALRKGLGLPRRCMTPTLLRDYWVAGKLRFGCKR